MFGIKELIQEVGLLNHRIANFHLDTYKLDTLSDKISELEGMEQTLNIKLEIFEDNIKRLELMMNEFKGFITLVRASIVRKLNKTTKTKAKKKAKEVKEVNPYHTPPRI
jgi:hypothetical protein